MNSFSPSFCRYFKLRLLAATLCLAGFWVCAGKAWQPMAGRVAAQKPVGGGGESAAVQDPGSLLPPPGLPLLPPATVVIDAGHGGADGGTPAGGMIEKDWTLKVALALEVELKSRGHSVTLVRSGDETVPLPERPVLINSAPRSAVISIHFNAGAADARGIETLYSWPKRPEVMAQLAEAAGLPPGAKLPDEGARLASAIQNAVQDRTGARDRGIKNREDLALTSRCLCPAVIVECGFLSNAEEGKLIKEESYRAKLVRGIADGYENWLLSRDSLPSRGFITTPPPPAHIPAGDSGKSGEGGAEH